MAGSGTRVAEAVFGGALGGSFVLAVVMALLNHQYAAMTFIVSLVVGFVANLLFAATLGVAWHHIAYRNGWRSVFFYCLPAAALGLLIPLSTFALPSILSGSEFDVSSMTFVAVVMSAIGIGLGGLTGLFAWLLRRPDRDVPSADGAKS